MDIGCSFFCQAHVPDASKVFVCLGMGIFCEMSHGGALEVTEKKRELLQKRIDHLSMLSSEFFSEELERVDLAPGRKTIIPHYDMTCLVTDG